MPSRPDVSRSMFTVQPETVVLLIARDIAQFGQLLHPVHETRNPLVEKRLVRRIERYWYCVRLIRSSTVRSCTGCK